MKLVVSDEFAQRDRFMRENLDAMAQKVGEMQAKLIKLEAVSERVSGMAGLEPRKLQQPPTQPAAPPRPRCPGGPLVPAASPSPEPPQGSGRPRAPERGPETH